jgi:hypothetical protein
VFIPSLASGFILTLGGIIAILAGGLFLAQKELRKNISVLMISAFLILYGLLTFGIVIPNIIMGFLALSAAAFTSIRR